MSGREKREQQIETLVTPDTLLRWYRDLAAKKYDGSARRGPGRPRTAVDIAELVLRMARENGGWGYTRIRGAIANVGHTVGRNNTISMRAWIPRPNARGSNRGARS